MDKTRENFYLKNVDDLIKDKNSSVLVCGGGQLDKQVFERLGFSNVTISNLDERMEKDSYHPFKWSFQNAEQLSFNDKSFDFVVIHAAIHHASSPHRVLTEMYRVASKGVLAFESRDSFIMRILVKLNLTQKYEYLAVFYNDCKYGGMNNTEIPNFVYRWTEREIEKTIKAFSPYFKHSFTYKYGYDFPYSPELEKKGKMKIVLLKLCKPFYSLFVRIFPKQQNLFAFYIKKPSINKNLFPWLEYVDKNIKFNKKWDGIYEKYKAKDETMGEGES